MKTLLYAMWYSSITNRSSLRRFDDATEVTYVFQVVGQVKDSPTAVQCGCADETKHAAQTARRISVTTPVTPIIKARAELVIPAPKAKAQGKRVRPDRKRKGG